jgi:hypothetical protein
MDRMKSREQEIRARPHVAAGNHHRQVQVFILVRQAVRRRLEHLQHFQAAIHAFLLRVDRQQPFVEAANFGQELRLLIARCCGRSRRCRGFPRLPL